MDFIYSAHFVLSFYIKTVSWKYFWRSEHFQCMVFSIKWLWDKHPTHKQNILSSTINNTHTHIHTWAIFSCCFQQSVSGSLKLEMFVSLVLILEVKLPSINCFSLGSVGNQEKPRMYLSQYYVDKLIILLMSTYIYNLMLKPANANQSS